MDVSCKWCKFYIMPSPVKAAQGHYNYFFHMQGALPPDPKWAVGLEVAGLWLEYCKDNNKPEDNQEIISIIKIFMPFRRSGTGFLAVWQHMLGFIAQLPVSQQKEIWHEIFNSSNQGEQIIENNEEALQTVQKWVSLANSSNIIQINENIMVEMANDVYKEAYSSYEWIGLTAASNEWFRNYVDEPSFFSCII